MWCCKAEGGTRNFRAKNRWKREREGGGGLGKLDSASSLRLDKDPRWAQEVMDVRLYSCWSSARWRIIRALRTCTVLDCWCQEGGVENVQYAINHKRKGGGSARPVRSARSASHLEHGLFFAIFLPGIDFVVVQHLIRGLYHKREKRQQPLVRVSGRSTSLVSGIVPLEFLAVQVSVQFCIRSLSSCWSSCWLIVVRLACRQFSGSGEASGASGG